MAYTEMDIGAVFDSDGEPLSIEGDSSSHSNNFTSTTRLPPLTPPRVPKRKKQVQDHVGMRDFVDDTSEESDIATSSRVSKKRSGKTGTRKGAV
jgi:hypothetical protein